MRTERPPVRLHDRVVALIHMFKSTRCSSAVFSSSGRQVARAEQAVPKIAEPPLRGAEEKALRKSPLFKTGNGAAPARMMIPRQYTPDASIAFWPRAQVDSALSHILVTCFGNSRKGNTFDFRVIPALEFPFIARKRPTKVRGDGTA